MMPMTLAEVAAVVAGSVVDGDDELVVSGAAFLDSRLPEPGGLFVALAGEQVDGHDYARAALEGGAAAVLGTRATGAPSVLVEDATTALQELARSLLVRRRAMRSPLSVVAVTGSQGKTSVKDMLARVLADDAPTVATAGSFNNELGLPLTVLRADASTRYLVLEMGARGVGHLAQLCAVAPPDVSLVLNVGKAHLGEFGSQAQIAVAKGELVEALDPATGTAVLNADDLLVAAMRARTGAATVLFGRAPTADVRLGDVELDDLGRPVFDLSVPGTTERVRLHLIGAHQAVNAAAAAAVGLTVGIGLESVAASLRSIGHLSRWRMELVERPDGLAVVNDAYNANPDSMRAALETLARMGRSGRRTVAVLGEMRELGGDSEEEHREVGRLAHRLGIDVVLVVGEEARGVHDALVEAEDGNDTRRQVRQVRQVGTTTQAGEWLRENVSGPDVVLIKASRGARLERVADMLTGTPDGTPAREEAAS